MFGRKKKDTVMERPGITLDEAISLAVRAQSETNWKTGDFKVHGLEGRCVVGTHKSSPDLSLHSAHYMVLHLMQVLGKGYAYSVTLMGKPMGSLGETVDATRKHFDSLGAFAKWEQTREARMFYLSAWSVAAEKK